MNDSPSRRKPVSVKNLCNGGFSWYTIKIILRWIVDTIIMKIHLPLHCVKPLWEILNSIPNYQSCTSMKKWHTVLGKLRSMAIALTGACHIFGRLQNVITPKSNTRVDLSKGVHQDLDNFRWIAQECTSRPTRINELIQLSPLAEGHHDSSGKGAGGFWFPGDTIQPREEWHIDITVLWHIESPEYITRLLVSSKNPTGTITNSELELSGGIIHLEATAQTFDTRKRNIARKGNNLNTTFWERKDSTTTNLSLAYLLRLFVIHQRYHRYVLRFYYITGRSNHVADTLLRDFYLSWTEVFSQFSLFLSQ